MQESDGILMMLNFSMDMMRKNGAEIGEPEEVQVQHVISRHNTPRACYENASRIVMDLKDENPVYVLGYVIVCGCPIEHAWVKVPGYFGHADPTLDRAVTGIP